tara:strand:- start:165 stop:1313 length:1149 start_codon:yes stop_codon:yes gene_type:complete
VIKFINHSNYISNHWNWSSKIIYKSIEEFHLEVTKHGFTHVDAPSHMINKGKSLNDCDLDMLCGWAKIIDVSECMMDKPITRDFLEKKANNIKKGDIVVLKSNLNDKYPNTSEKYWKNSPYLEDSGSKFLISKNIKAIVFDFPQDRAAKDLQFRVVKNNEFTEHQIVLGAGVMHVEHVIKLNLIKSDEFFFFALPIKLPYADGGNCTPISIHNIEKKEYSIVDHSKTMENNKNFKSYLTLSFEKGDQVQETGFSLVGLTHTMFISSNKEAYDNMFEKLVIDKFEIVSDINELRERNYGTVFINNEKIDYDLMSKNLTDKKIDILCLSSQPSIEHLQKIQKKVDKIFINLENINKINYNSKIIFGILKFENSLVSPVRVVSIS